MAWGFEKAESLEEMENELRRCHVPENVILEMRTIGKGVETGLVQGSLDKSKDRQDSYE